MSYVGRHTGLDGITTVVNAAQAIVEDPCLGQVATMVLRLHELTPAPAARPATPGQPKPPAVAPRKGIGLCVAVTPLKAAIWIRQRPWVVPVGALALVGGIFVAGMAAGRRRR